MGVPTVRHQRKLSVKAFHILGLSALVGCGPARSTDGGKTFATLEEIVGGNSVPIGAFGNLAWLDNMCSAVLIHPELILTAAHCSSASAAWFFTPFTLVDGVATPTEPEATLSRLERCEPVPGASLYDGTDLAVCVLDTAIKNTTVIPPLQGCEQDRVGIGSEATLLGFGYDENGTAGTLRAVTSEIVSLGKEVLIGVTDRGTCAGDSGGPAFVRIMAANRLEWRLLGILSSGSAGGCGAGYYASVPQFTEWIENITQRDVTPCHDAGAWIGGPSCLSPSLDDSGRQVAVREYSATCGAAFDPGPGDEQAPELELIITSQHAPRRIDALILASDVGWGVKRVELQLLDEDQRMLEKHIDEIPPYKFTDIPATETTKWIRAIALDHAGLRGAVMKACPDPENPSVSGCTLAHQRTYSASPAFVLLALTFLSGARRLRLGAPKPRQTQQ